MLKSDCCWKSAAYDEVGFILSVLVANAQLLKVMRDGVRGMKTGGISKAIAAGAAALMMISPSVAAAQSASASAQPMIALSLLASAESRAAVCATSVAAAAAAAAQASGAQPGCVLPVVDAPPPVVNNVPPPEVVGPPPPPVAAVVPGFGASGVFAALLGVGFLVAALAILGRGSRESTSP